MVKDIEGGVGLVAAVIVLAACLACHVPAVWLVVGPAIGFAVGCSVISFFDGSMEGRRAVNLL